jgi:hypothetical protein
MAVLGKLLYGHFWPGRVSPGCCFQRLPKAIDVRQNIECGQIRLILKLSDRSSHAAIANGSLNRYQR